MFIGRVSDGNKSGHSGNGDDRNDYHEYRTANELYEIMAESQRFDSNDETLTAGDLVILYKNLDIGTKLMTEAKYSQTKQSNQYVETVVHNDDQDSEESDIGEIYSSEDIRNLMMINKERIDLLSNTTSYDNNLCQKFGNIAVNHSNLAASYNKNFLFKDPFIKDQIKSFTPTNLLPNSLLDYICCKRLEDNYNFYMDSVITYVQHTIEHLKRISNGDYLTEKAKKKWKEVDAITKSDENVQTPILANSISIPLRMELKQEKMSTFNDVVHSAVDIRSLSKILEKKIVLEIPKLICGTYKFFSKRINENLIISCKKESVHNEAKSRVDVVLKLNPSEPGYAVSQINSILIVQAPPRTSIKDLLKSDELPSLCEKENDLPITDLLEAPPKIIELTDDDKMTKEATYESSVFTNKSQDTYEDSLFETDTDVSSESPRCKKNNDSADTFLLYRPIIDLKTYTDEQTEANFHVTSPNELRTSVQRLNMNSPVPEETDVSVKKKKSTSKIRIKSPYDNSSHAIEEKKRKRLLEIRERRENKKKALSENCKISKHKYSKGAVMAQASNSVTKISITNKSFYNSIYGQTANLESKNLRVDRKLQNKDLKILVELQNFEEEQAQTPKLERNREKYINHSYYLDEADTEVMRIQMKQTSDTDNTPGAGTASSSVVSDEFGSNLSLLKELMNPSEVCNEVHSSSIISQDTPQSSEIFKKIIIDMDKPQLETIQSVSSMVPSNSPKNILMNSNKDKKECVTAEECRKSIDEIYDLMKKSASPETTKKKLEQSSNRTHVDVKYIEKEHGSIPQSDSGTSLKHQLTSTIPSCLSFENINNSEKQTKNSLNKKSETPTLVTTPKILTNGKSQSSRLPDEKLKKDRKKMTSPVNKVSENPLKAISQLLHEFDNINKKNRNKSEIKSIKKPDNDMKKDSNRQVTFKKPLHQEQQSKESDTISRISPKKVKKPRPNASANSSKQTNKSSIDEKLYPDKITKKKVTDLTDEVKEAKGEAVRGPLRVQSRLDSLAQPKKTHIQAHNDSTKNIRHVNNAANRQRVINHSAVLERRETVNIRQKKVPETAGCQTASSAVPPLGFRRSTSGSPDGNQKRSPVSVTAPSHKPNVPETPETLMKRMATVELYVNNHYGRTAPIRDLKDFIGAQKSRVPLIPTDLDMGSVASSRTAEESSTLGKKLHHMIDTMIKTTPPALTSLREKNEIVVSKDNSNEVFVESIEQCDEVISNSKYPTDIFGDKSITTAVASIPRDNEFEETMHRNTIDFITYGIQPFNSTTELERLENALYRRLSAATFHKRLRIKNLTLTPKHSLQQGFILHSGDAGSMVIKSQLSKSNSKYKMTSKINKPTQSNDHFDWTFADFPGQVTTVGYAMPVANNKTPPKDSNSEGNSNTNNSGTSGTIKSDAKANKTIQCFKGSSAEPLQDQSIQANSIVDSVKPVRFEFLEDFENKSSLKLRIDSKFSQENTSNENRKLTKLSESQEFKLSVISNHQFLPNRIDIDNTTSLDILVGLLNEIKNITTCQTYIAKHESSRLDACEKNDRKELQFILKNAELHEDSVDLSPENALSYDSIKHDYQNSFVGAMLPSINSIQPMVSHSVTLRHDKEVNVSIAGIEYVHTFTEVPSRFLPISVHHGTNVTSSLIGLISQPSEQSLYSFSEYQTLYCNSSFNRIIELPNVEPKKSFHALKCAEIVKNKNNFNSDCITLTRDRTKRICSNMIMKNDMTNVQDILKIKRDVLVTVYSILVMTVFAALSLPEILYRM